MRPVIYGIKNCDTIRKARRWLEHHQLDYHFHDYRTDGLSGSQLRLWSRQLGWENLLNTRGTTFRQLPAESKQYLDEEKAIALLLAHPAMIKRPLLVLDTRYLLGFNPEQYQVFFELD